MEGGSSTPNFLPHAVFSVPCRDYTFSSSALLRVCALCQLASLALVNDVSLSAMGPLFSGSLGQFKVVNVDQAATTCC